MREPAGMSDAEAVQNDGDSRPGLGLGTIPGGLIARFLNGAAGTQEEFTRRPDRATTGTGNVLGATVRDSKLARLVYDEGDGDETVRVRGLRAKPSN